MHKRSLESLQDVELHKKLLEYNLPSVPITETTRPLLIKKLKTHIQSSRRAERQSTNATQQFAIPAASAAGSATITNEFIQPSVRPYQSLTAQELQNTSTVARDIALRNTSTGNTSAAFEHNYNNITPRPYINNANVANKLYKRYSPNNSDSEEEVLYGNSSTGRATMPNFGVVGRLLNLRDSTLQYKKSPLTPHEYNEYAHKRIYSQIKPAYATHSVQQTLWQRIKALAHSWRSFKQLHIPQAIIFVFVVFLIVIASVYLIKHPDLENMIRESNTQHTVCGAQGKPLQNCLEQQSLSKAVNYNRELIQLLQQQALQHYCVNGSLPVSLSTQDFLRYLIAQGHGWDMRQLLRDFQASVYLIKHNPQWQVSILNDQGTTVTQSDLVTYVADGDTRFVLLKPNLPLSCVLYNKIQRFFIIIGTFVLVLSICLVIYVAFRRIQQIKQERQAIVANLCTEIVNEVLYQSSVNAAAGGTASGNATAASTENKQQCEIILSHLRDKLLPLNKRKQLMNAWNEALRLLESYESRLQFCVTLHNGEHCRCVRWVGNIVADSRDLSFRKQWQSPAFDNVNRICNPPTPCLKIRHMFDSSEVKHPNLKKVIEEAIFEKVGARCNILDIQLDLQTCCVYVRCASEEDAGIVHNEINGWWFDKRLVSIKFLRLQRYLSRFPESKS